MPTSPQNKATAVANLQRYLRRLSFDDPRIPRVPVDGIFDTVTEEAVRAFQDIYALPVTGRADLATFERLYAEYERALARTDRTPVLHLFPTSPENYVLQLGEESVTVSFLQVLLQELGIIYDTLEWGEVTGVFDELTERNVRRIQRAALLPETGKVDLLTWNRILRDFNHYANESM